MRVKLFPNLTRHHLITDANQIEQSPSSDKISFKIVLKAAHSKPFIKYCMKLLSRLNNPVRIEFSLLMVFTFNLKLKLSVCYITNIYCIKKIDVILESTSISLGG